ncbi:HAMP domain-containing histidine kinase [Galbibacter sp. BG1]|uniref:sensor histidine kinase n=1 Tax=Galbibacter sp. BG1 TaxID=1170699 RepID=UPI0015B96E48|nr:HAMP domain-containing sensor histidine kinase [Galbibacter sp. BG1]QLE00830.1 HAMP domain-containing histidine kinase [Galbibacter sp. BG1]
MLNFRKIYIIVFVISVIGLAVVQYQYLKIGLNLAKVQFNAKVGDAMQTIQKDLSNRNELTFLIEQAITKNDSYFALSVDSIQDASSHFLNDFLVDRFLQQGIKTDFSYRLVKNDSTVYFTSPNYIKKEEDKQLEYPIVLKGYLPEQVDERLILQVQFEDINRYFLSQLNGLTIPSLIFIIAIIVVIVWVLRSFYWQKNVITTTNTFINNLTHELKTPVFSIGLATKLLDEKSDENLKPIVKIIKDQNDKLKTHIEKVLDLAGLENSKYLITLKEGDFKPKLRAICDSFQELSVLEEVDFSYDLQEGSYFILFDSSHLENAINNILDNAKKYAVENPKIRLQAFKEQQSLHIEIKDNGIGIGKEEQKKIFKKYFRVSTGDIHNVKGYGLGLSYVKEVIRLHKGRIELNSEVGIGTSIIIKLPIKKK